MAYAMIAYFIRLVSITCFNSKAMPTNDTDYIAAIWMLLNLSSQSYGVHITPHHTISYYSLGADTHAHAHTHTQT